jgi:predicted RNA-binding protein with PUA-like domain
VNHWLAKSEPSVYPWSQLVTDGRTSWTGIRSAEARNNLRVMEVGDRVAFYHSNDGKCVVGVATVVGEAYPDPTAEGDPRWLTVDLAPVAPLTTPVSLAQFRADPLLATTKLVVQGRVSVTPLSPEQFARMLELGGGLQQD